MSLDLSVAFDIYNSVQHSNGTILAYARIPFYFRNRAIFEEIQKKANPLNQKIGWYGDEGLSHIDEDPYGEPLTWIKPKDLYEILEPLELRHTDAALRAFIQNAPPDLKLVLYWH